MPESFPLSPSAEELYSSYKTAYSKLDEAEHTLPPVNQTAAETIEIADRLISASNLDIDARQEFLNKLAEMKNISINGRLRLQKLNVIAAKFAVDTEIIIARHAYAEMRNEWHSEALRADKARNRQ